MPNQFDVFANPIPPARRAFPFVIVLQADVTATGRDRIVAPLALRHRLTRLAGRLMPAVEVDGQDLIILVPSLTVIHGGDLRHVIANLDRHRDAITAAIDLLFFGI